MYKKILIFGGTFNPVHNGHVFMLESFAYKLKPDKIFVIPNNIPAHKSYNFDISGPDKLNMCRLAFENNKTVEVLDIEIKRLGKSYTVDTLREIKKAYKAYKLFFMVGADMFLSFQNWYKPCEILKLSTLCVVPRSNFNQYEIIVQKKFLKSVYKYANIIILDSKCIEVSSSQIRNLIKNKKNIDGLLPQKVAEYIFKNNLYGSVGT